MGKSIYESAKYQGPVGNGAGLCVPNRTIDTCSVAKPRLPGNVIVIHGVNDVLVGLGEVEKGILQGLGKRLVRTGHFVPADFRAPLPEDANKVLSDPDAVYFRRTITDKTFSPIIPFYWGYRPTKENSKPGTSKENQVHGQNTDKYGNRLDKDFGKGGGPFANATNTIPDMWNRGMGGLKGCIDWLNGDPLRPVLQAPGRMYMILAAKRLAALITMIRDYDENEAVSIVAHSQGCLISLLAQAFLMQDNQRPADTLILTHPPYSLVDDLGATNETSSWTQGATNFFVRSAPERAGETDMGGSDAGMAAGDRYRYLDSRQTLHARLQTLANIVHGVVERRHTDLELTQLPDHGKHRCTVGSEWCPSDDRDNRGKVYLYFCPEDLTVSFLGMQGIGWDGVPDRINGFKALAKPQAILAGRGGGAVRACETIARKPLDELMARNGPSWGFFQRVFTDRPRPPRVGAKPEAVKVGQAPHDFILRLKGEDDQAHADASAQTAFNRRAHSPSNDPAQAAKAQAEGDLDAARRGIRRITGEALKQPFVPDMAAGGLKGPDGKTNKQLEQVDPIDAAIATTSNQLKREIVYALVPDPAWVEDMIVGVSHASPDPTKHAGRIYEYPYGKQKPATEYFDSAINAGAESPEQRRQVKQFGMCWGAHGPTGQTLVGYEESSHDVRRRLQTSGTSVRSFHGAIFGSAENHAGATAYDLAIGGGRASSDPDFYKYLCAVADWRLRDVSLGEGKRELRPGFLTWQDLEKSAGPFAKFLAIDKAQRTNRYRVIRDNTVYYSTGVLPSWLPVLPEGLPPTVVCETLDGKRATSNISAPLPAPTRTSLNEVDDELYRQSKTGDRSQA